jgi:RNA polymerase sigma-70 factor (ECF subfamily)
VELGSAVGRARVEAFEAFYTAEYPRLIALARGLSGAQHAEDVAQEAMLVACRRWREISELERPDLWVRRTCANLAVSSFRRRLRDARLATRLASRGPEPAKLPESSDAVWAAVRRLPARQAQSIALRYVYDMPIAEVASALGCTEGTVKQHLSRARATLARELGTPEVE